MDIFQQLQYDFAKNYGNQLKLILFDENADTGIKIELAEFKSTFISGTIKQNEAYIDILNVEIQKSGYGTLLMDALVFALKKIGCKLLSGHVTNVGVLKILNKKFSENAITFHKKSFFGLGNRISFEEALSIPESEGVFFFAKI